jgi:hypothetical protein
MGEAGCSPFALRDPSTADTMPGAGEWRTCSTTSRPAPVARRVGLDAAERIGIRGRSGSGLWWWHHGARAVQPRSPGQRDGHAASTGYRLGVDEQRIARRPDGSDAVRLLAALYARAVPATLVTTGDHDDRVVLPRSVPAALQAARRAPVIRSTWTPATALGSRCRSDRQPATSSFLEPHRVRAAVRDRYGSPDVVELRDIDHPVQPATRSSSACMRRPSAGRPRRHHQPGSCAAPQRPSKTHRDHPQASSVGRAGIARFGPAIESSRTCRSTGRVRRERHGMSRPSR